jgi:hypothetical protein
MGNIFNNQEQQFPHDSCIMGITDQGERVFLEAFDPMCVRVLWTPDIKLAYHGEHDLCLKIWGRLAKSLKGFQRVVVPVWDPTLNNNKQ